MSRVQIPSLAPLFKFDSAQFYIGTDDVQPRCFLQPPYKVVRARGLEPLILAEPDPKSGVSANSTTRATLMPGIENQTGNQLLTGQSITSFWPAASGQSVNRFVRLLTFVPAAIRVSSWRFNYA
jgi:hypothetical protein